jgi:hypothetical protein
MHQPYWFCQAIGRVETQNPAFCSNIAFRESGAIGTASPKVGRLL